MTATVHTWREEARQDRLVRAQIERETAEVHARMRLDTDREREESRRRARADKAARKAAARRGRAERLARLAGWIRDHMTDLLFVPVITVPAVLAWTAMGAYGVLLYGPAGAALPAFSEGAMWAFAGATTISRRRHPERPVWHLRLGTVVFAAVGAALNFAHGMTAAAGLHGPVTGSVYAAVSVAGVTVHQLVTAGPRRSAAERGQARIDRTIARRERAARRAAVRTAFVALDEDGNARLVFEPGTASLDRHHGRIRLAALPTVPVAAPQIVDEDQADEQQPDDDQADDDPQAAESASALVPDAVSAPVPTDAEHAALIALRATHAAGNPLSGRQLETRFGLSRTQVTKVRKLALGDDGERHEDAAAKALLGLADVQVGKLRRLGEPDDCQADDDAGTLIPA